MATKTPDPDPAAAVAPSVPPVPADDDLKPGPGQVVVTSPTGLRSVVDEHAVDSLKHQGYKVG